MVNPNSDWYAWPMWKKWFSALGIFWGAMLPLFTALFFALNFFISASVHEAVDNVITPIENKLLEQQLDYLQMRSVMIHFHGQEVNDYFQRSAYNYRPYEQLNCLLKDETVRETANLQ